MDLLLYAALAAVSFAAAVVQSATGFGFAILAVPVFLLLTESLAAIQIAAVACFALSLSVAPWLFRDAPRGILLRLVLGTAAGLPVGLAIFLAADLDTAKLAVGGFITAFALLLAWREWRGADAAEYAGENAETGENGGASAAVVSRPLPELGAGAVSGVMASALAMPGPAVMLYLAALRPGKHVTRAVTLTLFGFSYGAVCLIHTLWGGMDGRVWLLSLGLVPFVLAGAGAGHVAARHLSEHKFRLAVLAVLLASGLYAVWNAL
jgi:uncharacterized membrane protein YfcA